MGDVFMGLKATLPNHIPACRSELIFKQTLLCFSKISEESLLAADNISPVETLLQQLCTGILALTYFLNFPNFINLL